MTTAQRVVDSLVPVLRNFSCFISGNQGTVVTAMYLVCVTRAVTLSSHCKHSSVQYHQSATAPRLLPACASRDPASVIIDVVVSLTGPHDTSGKQPNDPKCFVDKMTGSGSCMDTLTLFLSPSPSTSLSSHFPSFLLWSLSASVILLLTHALLFYSDSVFCHSLARSMCWLCT